MAFPNWFSYVWKHIPNVAYYLLNAFSHVLLNVSFVDIYHGVRWTMASFCQHFSLLFLSLTFMEHLDWSFISLSLMSYEKSLWSESQWLQRARRTTGMANSRIFSGLNERYLLMWFNPLPPPPHPKKIQVWKTWRVAGEEFSTCQNAIYPTGGNASVKTLTQGKSFKS